jgi:hypothetical protein
MPKTWCRKFRHLVIFAHELNNLPPKNTFF